MNFKSLQLHFIWIILLSTTPFAYGAQDTVIIGMGPAGLMSAYHQLNLGHKVIIIEEREDPLSRNNRFLPSRQFLNHILNLFTNHGLNGYEFRFSEIHKGAYQIYLKKTRSKIKSDKELAPITKEDQFFLDQVIRHHGTISIKELQQYLLIKLKTKAKPNQLELIKSAVIVDININDGTITFKNSPRIVSFQNLIIADGNRRKATTLLFKSLDLELKLHKLPMPRFSSNGYGVMSLNVVNILPDIQQAIEKRPFISPPLTNSSRLYPDHSMWFFCLQYLDDYKQFYVFSEIPANWLKLSTTEFAKQYTELFSNRLKAEYPGLQTDNLQLKDASGKQFVLPFVAKPTYLKQPYFNLGNDRRAFIIGDALITSHILVGKGIENSALSSYAVSECFDSSGNFISSKPVLNNLNHMRRTYFNKNFIRSISLYLHRHPIQQKAYYKIYGLYVKIKHTALKSSKQVTSLVSSVGSYLWVK